MNTVFEKIVEYIKGAGVQFKHIHHAPTHTSEQSAAARGESLDVGAKAMVVRGDDQYALFVLSASRKLDSKKVKSLLGCRSMRFASAEELQELTSLVPGSVPPFGRPILPFALYVDTTIEAQPYIAFNAGTLSDSIIMGTNEYLQLCQGRVCAFSKEEG